jgi:hypothetical protein
VLLAFMPAEKLFLIDAATFAVSATAFAWLGRRAALRLTEARATAFHWEINGTEGDVVVSVRSAAGEVVQPVGALDDDA